MPISPAQLKKTALHQGKEFLWVFAYLWLCFGLFLLYKSLILAEHDISFAAHGLAFVKALVLGKVILVAKDLHLGERYKNKPLIYPTLYKSVLFFVVLVLFSLLEEIVHGLLQHQTIGESLAEIGGKSPVMLTYGLIMFVTLIPFFAFQEIGGVLGESKLSQLFFVKGAKAMTDRSPAQQQQ
jgi:hypothetical protein